METPELLPNLFRTEYRKLTSVLVKLFGFDHIETIEDLVSDTFLLAAESWGQKGIPKNPTGWLYKVSRNKILDYFRRKAVFNNKVLPELIPPSDSEIEIDFSEKHIYDSQLQMMFAVCHPTISSMDQICLSLNILCGFGAQEIADAFLSTESVIYKRLSRAKEKLRADQIPIELPSSAEINQRLETVLTTLYLLFSEGYYSTSKNTTLRKDLCLEAIRLCVLLTENSLTGIPSTYALLSLMCFHSSRFEARTNQNGDLILYDEQDESLWNQELIERGEYYLNKSSTGIRLSKYHLEAGIAYWHTQKKDTDRKWENILQLYNQLLQIEYSPMAALNRTYALAKANGVTEAITEAEKLKLNDNHFYFTLLGELYKGIDVEKARKHFTTALSLAKSSTDKQTINRKLDQL